MKKVLITGANSFIGNAFSKWISENNKDLSLTEISVRGEGWKSHDFSLYDSVLHLAGIAHVSIDPSMENEYYKINTDLAIEVAQKSKESGVKHFIFMSSMIVYGDVVGGKVDENTFAKPDNFYGNSKLQAENGIKSLSNANFKVAVLRPPMIYGPQSKGNYRKLSNYSKRFPIFPKITNKRSMLFIGNLNSFLFQIIINELSGLYFPQNKEYVCTSSLVQTISNVNNKPIYLLSVFNFIIKKNIKNKTISKVFGNLYYEQKMSKYKFDYQDISFYESIIITEEIK